MHATNGKAKTIKTSRTIRFLVIAQTMFQLMNTVLETIQLISQRTSCRPPGGLVLTRHTFFAWCNMHQTSTFLQGLLVALLPDFPHTAAAEQSCEDEFASLMKLLD